MDTIVPALRSPGQRPRSPRLSERRKSRHAGDWPQCRRTLARLLRLERFRNALGTPGSYAAGVNMGLPATAAIVDMLVGTPSPFASALEQAPDGVHKAGHGLARPRQLLLSKESRQIPTKTTHEEEF